jgi:hypothetical protein
MTCVPTCYVMRIFRIFKHYTDGRGVYLTPGLKNNCAVFSSPVPSCARRGNGMCVN